MRKLVTFLSALTLLCFSALVAFACDTYLPTSYDYNYNNGYVSLLGHSYVSYDFSTGPYTDWYYYSSSSSYSDADGVTSRTGTVTAEVTAEDECIFGNDASGYTCSDNPVVTLIHIL